MNFHLRLGMPSHPRFLSVVRTAVGELSVIYGLSEEECHGVTLAVDEALANIIRHAYKNRDDQKIEFDCDVNDGANGVHAARPGRTTGSGQNLRPTPG